MRKALLTTIFALSCTAASAGSLCPYDTPQCRMMPDRYIAPQFNQPMYNSTPPALQFRRMLPDGSYGRSPQMNPDGSYNHD